MNDKNDVLNGLDGPLPENTPKEGTGYGPPPKQPDLTVLLGLRFNFIEESLQDTFDFVVEFLREQGKPAMEGKSCTLLASDGSQCAIGAFLKPETVNNYLTAGSSVERTLGELYALSGEDIRVWRVQYDPLDDFTERFRLLEDLQEAHDSAGDRPVPPNCWTLENTRGFVKVAEKHGLDSSKAQAWLAEVEASNE